MGDTPPLVELDDLEVRLGGRPVLDRLAGRLTGRVVGLLGPNGAGKTTLLGTLLGFHRPSSGGARLLGLDVVSHRRELLGRVGYMPENDAYVAGQTAVSFVRMMAELSGLPPKAVATTGLACSMASRLTSPKVSKQIEGVTNTSVAA